MSPARPPLSARAGFRPEIEGLRAIAALLVAVYHIWLGRVSGGVDVFFVVSSFLITRSLLGQFEKTGRISYITFWSGLARRLLPIAMLVLVTVVIAALIWLPRPLWENTRNQVVASAFYFQNWRLAFSAVDYLDQGMTASPVQHFWALSIQGQFYLLWPLLVNAAVLTASRAGVNYRKALLGLFAGLFVVSIAYSVFATARNQPFTYFNTAARLWEFCLGGILAVLPALSLRREQRVAMGWVGLVGIVSCGLVLQVSRVFPGYAALWPVGSAALIMLAGTSGSRLGADRLLSLRPLVYLGGISYAIYLWHWPILTYYRWISHQTAWIERQNAIGLTEGVGILLLSVLLAAVSTRWVEKPLRSMNLAIGRPWQMVALLVAGLSPVVLSSAAWSGYIVEQKKFDHREIALEDPDYPGARAHDIGFRYAGAPNVPVYPGMLAVRDDLPPIYRDGCYQPDAHWQRKACIYGDRTASRTIALVGGSHSVHWLPALDPIARATGWRIVVYTKSNCLFSEPNNPIAQDKWCLEWNAQALEILLEDRPDVVFTTATRGSGAEEHVPQGFVDRWSRLTRAGIKVVAVRDTPWLTFWVPECVDSMGADSPECGQPRSRMLAPVDPTQRFAGQLERVGFIDMSDYFCDAQLCPPVIGNVLLYTDDSHLTVAYARTLGPVLWRKLAPLLPTGDGARGTLAAASAASGS